MRSYLLAIILFTGSTALADFDEILDVKKTLTIKSGKREIVIQPGRYKAEYDEPHYQYDEIETKVLINNREVNVDIETPKTVGTARIANFKAGEINQNFDLIGRTQAENIPIGPKEIKNVECVVGTTDTSDRVWAPTVAYVQESLYKYKNSLDFVDPLTGEVVAQLILREGEKPWNKFHSHNECRTLP